uniref:General transcription factor IIH subunit 3 n=1 Tax=Gadus morhua TaxID=8049 RepID=A0A8C5B5M9_GADMO
MASEDELNLLVIVMDVNPIWWGQQAQREPEFTLSKCLDAVMVMGNSHMAMTTTNRLAVISSHFQDSHFLYPCKNWTGGDGAWDGTMDEAPYCGDGKYELLSVANNVVAEEMKRVMSTTEMKGNSTDTLLAGSLAKALCYIHRMTKELEDRLPTTEFYCRFERPRDSPDTIPKDSLSHLTNPTTPSSAETWASTPHTSGTLPSSTTVTTLCLHERDVNKLFKRPNPRKAAGPDSVSPSPLKHFANQLSPMFTEIFNTSLETCHVPACFKVSTIIPVPKKPRTTGLNDYRPVALTSVVMELFERLVLSHLKSFTNPLLDPLQFAYRANRCVDDANMALHYTLPSGLPRNICQNPVCGLQLCL